MSFIPLYDLESLNEQQRQDYVKNVCIHMGVPPELNLVMLTYLDEDNDGPRRLVAYAKRGATEIIRNNRGINVTELTSKEIGGSVVFTATGKDNTGRQEMSTGSKFIAGLMGKELDDAIMTSQTRACRRMTLQFVGAGVLDESEVNPNKPVQLKETAFTSVATAPQPSVQLNSAPGKDITIPTEAAFGLINAAVAPFTDGRPLIISQEDFSKRQEQLRQDAIAQLNAKHKTSAEPTIPNEPEQGTIGTGDIVNPALTEPKPKRKYVRKARVDMGPSEPPVVSLAPAVQSTTVIAIQPTTAPALIPTPPATVGVTSSAPGSLQVAIASGSKPRLSPEQVKPFRQRQFKFVNELEENGFLPKEGMGNQDKMRAFAGLMFPEVTNFNELTVDQWEKYLTTIEAKLKTVGPKDTVKYIEDAIGI